MTLGRREKITISGAGTVLAIVLIYIFLFEPSLDRLHSLRNVLPSKSQQLKQVEKIAAEERARESQVADLRKRVELRGPAFGLFGFMGSTASGIGIGERCQVELMSQRQEKNVPYKVTSVRVTLQGVSLKELTDFLSRVCAPDKLVTVDTIEIVVAGAGKTGLKVEMAVSTLLHS